MRRARLKVEPSRFRWSDYRRFLSEHADGIADFSSRQREEPLLSTFLGPSAAGPKFFAARWATTRDSTAQLPSLDKLLDNCATEADRGDQEQQA